MTDLLHTLRQTQERTLAGLAGLHDDECRRQYHPDLSPLGWHAMHMAFIECYWLQEVVLGDAGVTQPLKRHYFPWLSPKHRRPEILPPRSEIMSFIRNACDRNLDALAGLSARGEAHPLMEKDYLPHFLLQHNLQHQETMQQILLYRALQQPADGTESARELQSQPPHKPDRHFQGGRIKIGSDGSPEAYDNELPAHETDIPPYALASRPVSNAQYYGFMREEGYTRREFWTEAGWRWLASARVRAPLHWRQCAPGAWYAVTGNGAELLSGDAPVYGLSHHEACAYAIYAGCRLPTEAEWEHAVMNDDDLRRSCGRAWEWCGNVFYPYPGFRAFPYDRYSTPWFDGNHYGLRGGSRYTGAAVRRPTFRNFYTPDKRHVFAGLRLAHD